MEIRRRVDSNKYYSHKDTFWDRALVCYLLLWTAKHKVLTKEFNAKFHSACNNLVICSVLYFIFNSLLLLSPSPYQSFLFSLLLRFYIPETELGRFEVASTMGWAHTRSNLLVQTANRQRVRRFGLLITERGPGRDDSNRLLESRLGPLLVIIVNQQQLSWPRYRSTLSTNLTRPNECNGGWRKPD